MQVNVLLSSGDEDEWVGVADAFDDAGSLVVVADITTPEVPEGMKTVRLMSEIDNGPDAPPGVLTTFREIKAIYAPGMWMKVEYS